MPRIELPYEWSGSILTLIGFGFLFASIAVLIWSICWKRVKCKRVLSLSLFFSVLFLTTATGYALMSYGKGSSMRTALPNAQAALTHVGTQLPDFVVTALNGTTIHSSELRGRVVVVGFVATWCKYCQKELPHLQEIWDELHNKGDFAMLAVTCGESVEKVTAFQSKHHFTLPMALDPERASCKLYAGNGIPHVYVLSRDGTIVYEAVGFREEEVAKLKRVVQLEINKR